MINQVLTPDGRDNKRPKQSTPPHFSIASGIVKYD